MSHDDPQGSLLHQVTLSLRDIGDATQLTLRQGEFATVALLAHRRNGWTDSLDKLRALGRHPYAAGGTPPAPAGRRQAGVAAGTLTA